MRNAGLTVVLAAAAAAVQAQGFPEQVARTSGGVQVDDVAVRGRMSADARFVAFATASAALDPSDTNGLVDVYVKDRLAGTIQRVSKGPGGALATGGPSGWDGFGFDTHGLAISDDGGRIAFLSSATNLVANDLNARRDAFLWDRGTGLVTLLSRSAGGVQGNDDCTHIAISGDGTLVAFSSYATNLVPGDTNATLDLFGVDVDAGTIERLSLTDADAQMPAALSADRGAKEPSLSRDGRYVAFIAEPDLAATDCVGQCAETWVRDRVAMTTVQASRFSGEGGTLAGTTVNARISASGRFVVWHSSARMALPDVAGGTLDVFLRDLEAGVTEHISQSTDGQVGHTGCGWPWVSADGRFVSFNCGGQFGPDDLHLGNDTYLRDRQLRQTLRFSVSSTQQHPNNASEFASISPDGRWLLFESQANNLVPGDTNGRRDVFLARNPFLFDPPSRIGSGGASASRNANLSDDGRYLFFETAEALLPGDTNGAVDIYRRELGTGALLRVSVGDNEAQIGSGGSEYSISADGESVVFIAQDDGSVALKGEPARAGGKAPVTPAVFLRNLIVSSTQRMGAPGTPSKQPALAKDGSHVAFVSAADGLVAGDTNGLDDVFLVPVSAPLSLTRVSGAGSGDANGASRAPALSGDGQVIVFETEASNLVPAGPVDDNGVADVVRVDLAGGLRAVLSGTSQTIGNGASRAPSISADGQVIAFASHASNLAGADGNAASDVFVVDLNGSTAPRLASGVGAVAGNGTSTAPMLSADGTTLAFASAASDLVEGDSNAQPDIFVLDRASLAKRRVARGDGGTQANGSSHQPRLSRDGQRLAFESQASNLSLLDSNGTLEDVFLNGPLEPFLVFRSRFE